MIRASYKYSYRPIYNISICACVISYIYIFVFIYQYDNVRYYRRDQDTCTPYVYVLSILETVPSVCAQAQAGTLWPVDNQPILELYDAGDNIITTESTTFCTISISCGSARWRSYSRLHYFGMFHLIALQLCSDEVLMHFYLRLFHTAKSVVGPVPSVSS